MPRIIAIGPTNPVESVLAAGYLMRPGDVIVCRDELQGAMLSLVRIVKDVNAQIIIDPDKTDQMLSENPDMKVEAKKALAAYFNS
jgi:hypothetical protein